MPRKSPTKSATQFKVGTKKKRNDGTSKNHKSRGQSKCIKNKIKILFFLNNKNIFLPSNFSSKLNRNMLKAQAI